MDFSKVISLDLERFIYYFKRLIVDKVEERLCHLFEGTSVRIEPKDEGNSPGFVFLLKKQIGDDSVI